MSSRAPGQAALTAWPWDLDPELRMIEQGPQGGGQEGKTTGRQTPKLSTKNGRLEPGSAVHGERQRTGGGGEGQWAAQGGAAVAFAHTFAMSSFRVRFLSEKRAL